MTREETIELKAAVGRLMYSDNKDIRDYNVLIDFIESALRPINREQVENVWRGEWLHDPETGYEHCDKCSHTISLDDYLNRKPPLFCEMCGAPMTDDAMQMVLERMEALHEDNSCS